MAVRKDRMIVEWQYFNYRHRSLPSAEISSSSSSPSRLVLHHPSPPWWADERRIRTPVTWPAIIYFWIPRLFSRKQFDTSGRDKSRHNAERKVPPSKFEVRMSPLRPPRLISWRCPIRNICAHTHLSTRGRVASPFEALPETDGTILYFHRPTSKRNVPTQPPALEETFWPSLHHSQNSGRPYYIIEKQKHRTIIDTLRSSERPNQPLGLPSLSKLCED